MCPTWISKEGEWYPAKEKVGLINHKTGEPYIYEGPDRAALFELWQDKIEKLGTNFKTDPEFIGRVRQLGYKSVEEYLESIGYDSKAADEKFKKEAETVTMHELPKKIKGIQVLGGGKDFSGQGQDKYGGFDKGRKELEE